MSWAIKDPRGVHAALRGESVSSELKAEPKRKLDEICGQNEHERMARLSVYAEAYFIRLCGSLKSDFPTLHRQMGTQNFECLVSHYLARFPSRTYNIGEVGLQLPKYLNNNSLFAEPYLADIALFDLKKIECFYTPYPEQEKHSGLRLLRQDEIPTAKVYLNSSIKFLVSQWDLLAETISLGGSHVFYHLRLQSGDICSLSLTPFEHKLVQQLESHTIDEVLAEIEDMPDDFDAEDFFQRLIRDEIIWDLRRSA